MKSTYRVATNGAFVLEPGAELTAMFDKRGAACTLTLHGALSEAQVFHFFDALVPLKERGVKKGDMLSCMGICIRNFQYENVTFTTGVIGKQTSQPAAIVTFTRPECKAAVAEASKMAMKMDSHESATRSPRP